MILVNPYDLIVLLKRKLLQKYKNIIMTQPAIFQSKDNLL